jgi:hypothetical protein
MLRRSGHCCAALRIARTFEPLAHNYLLDHIVS